MVQKVIFVIMNAIAIIPARYNSTRFPGKPLAMIGEKPMVQHVYERCKEVFQHVVVATDDERIAHAVEQFGGKCVITSSLHKSGTERCAEAAHALYNEIEFDIVVNVQGDEPFIMPEQLELVLSAFENRETQIATLCAPIKTNSILFDPNKVKVVKSVQGQALYFSRQAIPFQRDPEPEKWLDNTEYFMHLGLYAFRRETLFEITGLEATALENAEKLEQLRWLENGYRIQLAVSDRASPGVDTPDDLERLLKQ
jgi:3-deoxy-manno-octulosonate cytidylyltransferase (CMP-KDO synthetase)